uniref:Uncharacterized protein n=1 Tax=Oncorhynchus tshawytscha TaxID=74940 RepID=A0AAZ3R7L6_ONCTS
MAIKTYNLIRPDPPTDAIQDAKRGSSDNEVETKYLQSCRYWEMNKRLQEVRGELVQQREELRTAGEQLGISWPRSKGEPSNQSLRHHTSGLHLTSGLGEHLTSGLREL